VPRQRLGRHLNVTVLWGALGVVGIDALSKWWARGALAHQARHVWGPLWLRLTYNTGISFSLNRSNPVWTTVVAAALVVAVAAFALRATPGRATWGFALLLGGGAGNEINRLLVVPHRVTDFISVGWFPVFNVADAAVTVGLGLVAITMATGKDVVAK
jgi:signal peptidase II